MRLTKCGCALTKSLTSCLGCEPCCVSFSSATLHGKFASSPCLCELQACTGLRSHVLLLLHDAQVAPVRVQDPDETPSESDSDSEHLPAPSSRAAAAAPAPPCMHTAPIDDEPAPSEDVSWLSKPRQVTENTSQVCIYHCASDYNAFNSDTTRRLPQTCSTALQPS